MADDAICGGSRDESGAWFCPECAATGPGECPNLYYECQLTNLATGKRVDPFADPSTTPPVASTTPVDASNPSPFSDPMTDQDPVISPRICIVCAGTNAGRWIELLRASGIPFLVEGQALDPAQLTEVPTSYLLDPASPSPAPYLTVAKLMEAAPFTARELVIMNESTRAGGQAFGVIDTQPNRPLPIDEDLAEALYWQFDAARKDPGSNGERLEFKKCLREYARVHMKKLMPWTPPST